MEQRENGGWVLIVSEWVRRREREELEKVGELVELVDVNKKKSNQMNDRAREPKNKSMVLRKTG